jgi:hypothetical protein
VFLNKLVNKVLRRGDRPRETILTWRAAFDRSKEGKWAFARLLEQGGFLRVIETEEQKASHNFVVYLLENMGISNATKGVDYDQLAETLLALPVREDLISEVTDARD